MRGSGQVVRLYFSTSKDLFGVSLSASSQRDGGSSGIDKAVPHEDDGHDDDGRHGHGLLQRYENPVRARKAM